MKLRSLRYVIIAFICLVNIVQTNAQFNISAHYRPRAEFRDGYRNLASSGSVPSLLISQRTRLSISYQTDKLKIFFTPQDIRVWGDEQLTSSTGVFGDRASLDLFEGYAEIKIAKYGWISIGRQQLIYDKERLLGKRNWNQSGIAYDAIIIKTVIKKWSIHLGSSWNSLSETLTDNLYLPDRIKSLNFLWLKTQVNKKLSVSAMQHAASMTKTDSTNQMFTTHTSGLCFDYNKKLINLWGDFYYQYGKNNKGKNISAFLFDLDLTYKINKLSLGPGLSYMSGNDHPDKGREKLFNVYYGSRHKYFGLMDYFRDFPKNTREGGITDLYFYFGYNLTEKIKFENTCHYFRLSQTNYMTPANKDLGYENDIVMNLKFYDFGNLKAGYSFFLPTDGLRELQGVNKDKFSQFLYFELSLNTTLFSK